MTKNNEIQVFKLVDSADWLKLFMGEFHSPLLTEKVGAKHVHFCFANDAKHLFFSVDDAPLQLRLPRAAIESLNTVELVSYGKLSFEEWQQEVYARIVKNYKET